MMTIYGLYILDTYHTLYSVGWYNTWIDTVYVDNMVVLKPCVGS